MIQHIEKILELARTPVSQTARQGVVWTAHQMLSLRGFRWEVRRQGELKLGLWRKSFRGKTLRKPVPTRFVFIPGFGDTPLSWLPVFTLLEPVLRLKYDEIVLMDFPGYNGLLFSESLHPSLDSTLDSLFDVLDSIKPHTVTGHSLGGFLTAHYAAACSTGKRPTGKKQGYGDVQSSIVIDPSGFLESEEDRIQWEEKVEALIRNGADYWRPFIFAKEPFWFRFLSGHFLNFVSRPEVEPFIRSTRPHHELRFVLPEIRSRMALVWGENDSLLPPDILAPGWLRYLTNTPEPPQAVIIKGSGHSPQVEAPATTAAVLGQLLTDRRPHAIGERWYRLLEIN